MSRFKDGRISIENGDQYVIHKNGTLEITVAQVLNTGKYTCVATNNLGMKENSVNLEVKGKEPANTLAEALGTQLIASALLPLLLSRAHAYPRAAGVQGGAERNECDV